MDLPYTSSDSVREVAAILRRYCQGNADTHTVNRLVILAAEIARKRLWGRLCAAARVHETTIEQQAISIVAGLFRGKDAHSRLSLTLGESLKADDITLFVHFQRVVTRTASQELFHRWDETDPLSARLWRSLQRAIRHDRRLIGFPCDSPQYVALAASQPTPGELTAIEYAEAVGYIGELTDPRMSAGDVVIFVLMQAAETVGNPRAIKVEVLFAALRDTISKMAADELSRESARESSHPNLDMAVAKAVETAKCEIRSRLDKYVSDDKVDGYTAGCLRKALDDLIDDLPDGGPAQSYYQYLYAHRPDITPEEYRATFKTRFEYLAEAAQEKFYGYLREGFFA